MGHGLQRSYLLALLQELAGSEALNLAHAFRAIDVGRAEVTEHWYDQLFLVSHDVAFTEITDKIIELGE